MNRPTLGQFRAAGGSLLVGICQGDLAQTAAIVNLAQERLIMDPMAPDEGWWGGWATMAFTVNSTSGYAYIITPQEVARLINITVCDTPVRIRNGFYEYLQFGTGLEPKSCRTQVCTPSSMQAYDRDSVVTLNTFPSTSPTLRVYAVDPADIGKRIVFQGKDQNGLPILDIDPTSRAATSGETLYLNTPFADSVNRFSTLTGILKDATLGQVQVFSVDPTTGLATDLTTLEPNETTAHYRKYMLNGLPCACCSTSSGAIQVSAQAKLDFIPAYSDSDYLCILNIPALMEEVQAIRYSRMDADKAPQLEAKHHAKALNLLNGQLDHFLGKTSCAVSVPIFGSDRLKTHPR